MRIPFIRLVEAADESGRPIAGRRFVNCLILGPCVLGPGEATRFDHCSLGDAQGDVRNLFLCGAGPLMCGVVSIDGCVFEGCAFAGVGFAGTEAFVDAFVAALSRKDA